MLGVEIYRLWRAGRVDLPALAGVYRRAADGFGGVRHDDRHWCVLRAQLVSVLAAAEGQIEEAAAAVCVAAAEYARADAAAGAEFDRLRGGNAEGPR
ncbi:hypothetical protein GCM10010170_074650 [Dactylosporangium salmoneum]|uniref:Uncharacterized protein n=1 Tax=Dactylosporangium salmoneum TaxID=53361 RepID=A0ABN3H8M4_9ACTN